MLPFKAGLPFGKTGTTSIFCLILILLATTLLQAEGFLQNILRIKNPSTTLWAGTLQDRTVKELWQILEESNQMERGLRSQLKRKEDIIQYIEKHADKIDTEALGVDSENDNDSTEEEDERTEESKVAAEESSHDSDPPTNADLTLTGVDPEIAERIPPFLADKMIQRKITSLLPIQVESFQRIYQGEDTVLQAPTGSGKTLAFVLPIVSKKPKGQRGREVSPQVLVLVPSRELARQVGKEFDKFSKGKTVTVFGGVPIERQKATLRATKPQFLVSTPGRLRELHREGFVTFSQITTVVIDEADTLLDKGDSPDVYAILEDLEEDIETGIRFNERGDDGEYQLVLVSATMNENVQQFARELEIPSKALIRVRGSESKIPTAAQSSSSETDNGSPMAQSVQHWHMSCKTSVRTSVAMDLINIFMPNLTIIFVASKAEAEMVASALSEKLGGSVRALHGDMAQSARSRTIALIQEAVMEGRSHVLVATDVAARGIDLAVDLVIQFGVPRISGKEGTFSADLYTHRTGRTGRVRADGGPPSSNAVMLYDPAAGEGKLVPQLRDEVKKKLGIELLAKQLPSAAEVVASGYQRAKELVNLGNSSSDASNDLTTYFRQVIEVEQGVDTSNPEELLEYLARAMALLSNVDAAVSPFQQHASLLTGSKSDRTLRAISNREEALTPAEVTKACKSLGSGKLGRVIMCEDGSAVFDLPRKRAMRVIEASMKANSVDIQLELPLTLPEMEQ